MTIRMLVSLRVKSRASQYFGRMRPGRYVLPLCRARCHMPRSRWPFHVLLSFVVVASCGSDGITSIVGTTSQTIVAELGDEVQITLGNVGPGEYVSPPQISSTVLTFLSVDVVPPFTPAGPHQRFRFKTNARGQAIVSFRRFLNDSELGPSVDDTVKVR